MALLVLALLIGIPLIEIALFVEVGGWIGLWPTIAIVVLTAIIGTALLRRQGLTTLRRVQAEMEQRRLPVRELFDGACLLAAGLLLLAPGFLTDAIGFALLAPPLRQVIGMAAWRALQRYGAIHVRTAGFDAPPRGGASRSGGGPVIEGDYEDVSDDTRGTKETPDDGQRAPHTGATGSPWRH